MNPYPGLRPFSEDDFPHFHGRDTEIEKLLELLSDKRFVAVTGVSGSGKSSLVKAGVIPILHFGSSKDVIENWRVVRLRPSEGPLERLRMVLDAPEVFSKPYDLMSFARRNVRPPERLLVFVDQFEEIFDYRRERQAVDGGNECALFVNLLLAATDQRDTPVSVILTMRSDYLGECSQFRGLPEALNYGHYLVPRLTRLQQEEAIKGPAAASGVEFEPALVQRLLNDSEDNPDRLPLLQHILKRLWEQKGENSLISVDDYKEIGGWGSALENDARNVLERFLAAESEGGIARLFQWITATNASGHEIRRPRPFGELSLVTGLTPDRLREVVVTFARRDFLQVTDEIGDKTRIDLTHESVIWHWPWLLRLVRAEAALANQIDFYRESVRKRAWLFGLSLQQGEQLVERMRASYEWARRYLDEKEQQAVGSWIRKSRWLQRFLGSTAAVATLVAVGLLAFAFIESDRSRKLLLTATSTFLMYEPLRQQMQDGNDDVAALLFREAAFFRKQVPGFGKSDSAYSIFSVPGFRHVLGAHDGQVNAVAVSPDGSLLASGSEDGAVRVWDLRTPWVTPVELLPRRGAVRSLTFNRDGHTLASGGAGNVVRLWDIRQPHSPPTEWQGPEGGAASVAFSWDGLKLAAGGTGNKIWIWDLRRHLSNQVILKAEATRVRALAFSPDGQRLASGAQDAKIRIWDLERPDTPLVLIGHRNAVSSVAFSREGTLASGSFDKTVRIWKDPLHPRLFDCSDFVNSIAFNSDGRFLAAGCGDKTVRVWDVQQFDIPALVLVGHKGGVLSVSFNADRGQPRLASGGLDNEVRVWEVWDLGRKPGAPTPIVLRSSQEYVSSLAFNKDGRLASGGSRLDKVNVMLWDIPQKPIHPVPLASLSRGLVKSAALSPDGVVRSVAFSPDGNYLASGGIDSFVRVWDVGNPSAKPQIFTTPAERNVDSVAFSADSRMLAFGGEDDLVHVWKFRERSSSVVSLPGHQSNVDYVGFSPDGKVLVSGDMEGILRIWDVNHGWASLGLGSNYRSEVGGDLPLTWNTRWQKLATLTKEGVIRIWSISHRPASPFVVEASPLVLANHIDSNQVNAVFSDDGRMFALISLTDRTVRVWDLSRPESAPKRLTGFQQYVGALAFSPDNSELATSSADGLIQVWPLSSVLPETDAVCALVWRNLSMDEWKRFVGDGIPYKRTCGNLPPGNGAPADSPAEK